MSLYLSEVIPINLLTYIQTNIDAAIAAELAVFTDGIVPTVEPENYYDYEQADPAQCPSLYVLEDRIEYNLDKNQANHINATAYYRCGMIVEDFRQKEVVHSARRYANVLHKILNQAIIDYTVSGNVKARDVVLIWATSFGDTFKKNAQATDENGPFRREFVHELQIQHYENYS